MKSRTDVGTVEDLKASATKAVGLDDFGSDDDDDNSDGGANVKASATAVSSEKDVAPDRFLGFFDARRELGRQRAFVSD